MNYRTFNIILLIITVFLCVKFSFWWILLLVFAESEE
jgi:hypothetical protein